MARTRFAGFLNVRATIFRPPFHQLNHDASLARQHTKLSMAFACFGSRFRSAPFSRRVIRTQSALCIFLTYLTHLQHPLHNRHRTICRISPNTGGFFLRMFTHEPIWRFFPFLCTSGARSVRNSRFSFSRLDRAIRTIYYHRPTTRPPRHKSIRLTRFGRRTTQ